MMRKVRVTNIFKKNYNSNKTIVVNRGGARSSKSWSIAQLLIMKMTQERNKSILVICKTGPALKISAYKEIIDKLKDYDYYKYCDHNRTDNILIYRPTNAYILFTSLDNPEKIKSTGWNYIWMEEASSFTYADYMILKLRLSAPTDTKNHIYLSFNPISAFHWLKIKLVEVETDLEEIVSTYLDNPFLEQDYINILLKMKDDDKNYWKIYGEGLWGVLENIIYNNYSVVSKFPDSFNQTVYGLDFGYTHPTALIEINELDDAFYLKELIYETKLLTPQLIDRLNQVGVNKNGYIYGDSASPGPIEEIRRAGFNIRPCVKGQDSVIAGLNFCKSKHLYIYKDSVNLIREANAYKYKETSDGQVLEEALKFNDDAMDATRYGMYTHWANKIDCQIIL